jgi:acetyl-CoA synthetase
MTKNDSTIKVTLEENRVFDPTEKFLKTNRIPVEKVHTYVAASSENREKYWIEAARTLEWKTPFTLGLTGKAPFFEWFSDGKINASTNCLDRHVQNGRGGKRAILWEGEPENEIVDWTYQKLLSETEKLTATFRAIGMIPGDRVAIYMPLVPESVVAMLACARAGLTHTVIFGGFSAEAVKDRVNDAQVKLILTADFGYRKGAQVPLRSQVETALPEMPTVTSVLTLKRSEVGKGETVAALASGDKISPTTTEWNWYSIVNATANRAPSESFPGAAESLPAEHPLFILYTSGTTGKPKGLVHSTGGYLTGVTRSTELVFDLDSKSNDLYWCTADIGWITGHSYVVYGPLSVGASIFMYEGAPTTPNADRFWEMIERHKITILYTAPTAIRTFMKLGDQHPNGRDLSSLRLLGTVGEPINPEAWMWYRNVIGKGNCPIVDTYWQTETGSIVVSPIPSVTPIKPGSATKPLPGYDVVVLNKSGIEVGANEGGLLVIRNPFPSMARTIFGDKERFEKTYFSEFSEKIYFTGDGARKDRDGYVWCLGRVDDVLNVSGHRLGTMEIESTLVSFLKVAEAAVVGRPDEVKGQGIVAFVTLKSEFSAQLKKDPSLVKPLKDELRAHVTKEIGALARPDDIRFTDGLPKTRSGKIMRRLLRELATTGDVKGDTTTLEDLQVIASLRAGDEE